MDKLTLYLRESYEELIKNVSWPTMEQLIDSTIVVLVCTIIISTIIFLYDVVISNVIEYIY